MKPDTLLGLYLMCIVAMATASTVAALHANWGASIALGLAGGFWFMVVFRHVDRLLKEAEVKAFEDGFEVASRVALNALSPGDPGIARVAAELTSDHPSRGRSCAS